MSDVLFISGCGGAGKDTTGQLLISTLSRGALIDIDSLIRVEPWDFYEVSKLGIRNAASVVLNFAEFGYDPIIVIGGLACPSDLTLFEDGLPDSFRVSFFWLDVPKRIRDERRIKRARDPGDQAECLDEIDMKLVDPGELQPRRGAYHRIKAGGLSPEEVVAVIRGRSGLAVKFRV